MMCWIICKNDLEICATESRLNILKTTMAKQPMNAKFSNKRIRLNSNKINHIHMNKLNDFPLDKLGAQLKDLRKQKKIQLKQISEQMGIGISWASEMFDGLETLQTGTFIKLCDALDIDVHLDIKLPNQISLVEKSEFIDIIIQQWMDHEIDGNQAMRKIYQKLKN